MGSCVGMQSKVKTVRVSQNEKLDPKEIEFLRYQINKEKALNAPTLNLRVNNLYKKRKQKSVGKTSTEFDELTVYDPVTLEC